MTAPMLNVMRRQSSLVYVLFGAIIVLLALSAGPQTPGCSKSMSVRPWAARVNGETIYPQEYLTTVRQRLEMMRRLADEHNSPFDLAMAERLGIRRYVIEQLIERRLMAQAAKARGLEVSDEVLMEYLTRHFGVQDVPFEVYQGWVNEQFATSVDHFEEMARADAAAERLAAVVRDTITLSELELVEQYRREHDRVDFSYVRLDIDADKEAAPKPAVLSAVLANEHPAVETYYADHPRSWRIPEAAHLRQIVRTLPAEASEKQVQEAAAHLAAVRDQIAAGADFAAVAKEHSQDDKSKDLGGDLGYVVRGTLAPMLDAVAFALAPGALSQEPIRTPQGLHLLQLVEIRQAARQPLAEVEHEVAAELVKQRAATAAAKQRAQALLAGLGRGLPITRLTVAEDQELPDPSKLGAALDRSKTLPKLRHGGWVLRTDAGLPRIGAAPQLQNLLFAQPQKNSGLVGEPILVGEAYYVAMVNKREAPDMASFAQEREALREEALTTKRRRIFGEWLAYLRSQAKVDVNPALINAPLASGPAQEAS